MSERGAGFSRRVLVAVVATAVVSFLLALVLGAVGDDLSEPAGAGSDTFSYSAVGHRALYELLREAGLDVERRRSMSFHDIDTSTVLVALEPPVQSWSEELRPATLLGRVRARGGKLLLVMPKWRGRPALLEPGHVGVVAPHERWDVAGLFEAAIPEGYSAAAEVWRGDADAETELACGTDDTTPYHVRLRMPQLFEPTDLFRPVVECDGRWLALRGRSGLTDLLVLTDPDLLNNHGLARGDNAAVVQRLLAEFGDAPRVRIDETIHGHVRHAGVLDALLGFPTVLLSLHTLLLVGMIVWAGATRFGKPLPPPAVIAGGKRVLVDNAARLLELGGHSATSLDRYFRATLHEVAARRLPHAELPPDELIARLQQIGTARGLDLDLRAMAGQVARLGTSRSRRADRAVRLAEQLHRWRQEMLDGDR